MRIEGYVHGRCKIDDDTVMEGKLMTNRGTQIIGEFEKSPIPALVWNLMGARQSLTARIQRTPAWQSTFRVPVKLKAEIFLRFLKSSENHF